MRAILSVGFCAVLGLLLCACSTTITGKVPAPAVNIINPTMAVPCNTFLNSFGANYHLTQGQSLAEGITDASYCGLRFIRDGIDVSEDISMFQGSGAKIDALIDGSGGASEMTNEMADIDSLEQAGALKCLEGPNEPNNWDVEWAGTDSTLHGIKYFTNVNATNNWLPIAYFQGALYQMVKSDPNLNGIPLLSISDPGAEVNNVGMQWLVVPTDDPTIVPQFAGQTNADVCNCHEYAGYEPYTDANQTWSNSLYWYIWLGGPDETYAGDFSVTWFQGFAGYTNKPMSADGYTLSNCPRAITEGGGGTGSNQIWVNNAWLPWYVDEVQAANLDTWQVLDSYKNGFSFCCIYQLMDISGQTLGQGMYNLFDQALTRATNFHNLTTILSDTENISTPGTVTYSYVSNQPYTVHDLLLQKGPANGGNYYLVVWDENPAGQDTFTINLGGTYTNVQLYDPSRGSGVYAQIGTTSTVTLTESDHILIIELPANPLPVQPTPVPQPTIPEP